MQARPVALALAARFGYSSDAGRSVPHRIPRLYFLEKRMPTHREKMFRLSGVLLLAAMVAAVSFPIGAAEPLRILTGPPGGQWNALGNELARLLREAGIPAQSEPGGGVDNLRLVGDGEADIGFTLYSFLGAAGAGEKELPKVNLDNAVLLSNLYPQVLYIIVRKDVATRHKIKTLGDLLKVTDPIRFATLQKGTGSEFIFNMLLKSAYRTDYDALLGQGWKIDFASYADITKMFVKGDLDVCAYTAGPGTYLLPILEEKNLDAILIPVDEEMLNRMTHQFMTITYVIHKGDHKSIEEDILTLGDYSSLVTQKSLPEDVIVKINETLWNSKADLAKISRDMNHLSPRFAVAGQSQVHPGSLRFWNSPAMQAVRNAEKKP